MTPGLNAAKIVIYGFSFIFLAIGLGIAYGAVATFEESDPTKTLLMLFAALAFGGFGLAVYALSRAGFRKQAREEALRAANPDEPWKWREDWSVGRVRSSEKGAARFLWGFAIIWNAISTPMLLVLLPEEIIEKQNYGALIGLLFPLVGIGLIVAAVRKTIQERKFGECLFIMDRVPGVLGGELAGTILVPRGLSTAETLSVRLSCIREVRRRSGKTTTTDENVLWQTEKSSVQLSPAGEAGSVDAMVRLLIPYDTEPTRTIDENNRNFWKLEADAAVPGVDFATAFEIPVFKTEASSSQNTEEHIRSEEIQAGIPAISPADQTAVTVTPSAGGGTEFLIRPGSGASGTLPGIVIALIFGGIAVLLGVNGASLMFPLVFGAVAILIVLLLIFGAFGESRIVVEEGHISVRNSLFGIMSGRRMPCSSITKIGIRGEGKAGKPGHYSIILTQQDNKTASPLQFVREKGQADWLAEEVRKAVEPWRSPEHVRNS